jgi:hypothetical protein
MSKQHSIERAAQKSRAMLGQHVKELVGHTIEVSRYGGHGHAEGRQGRSGHPMPNSDAYRRSNARLPENIDNGFGGDDVSTRDYGVVDKGE